MDVKSTSSKVVSEAADYVDSIMSSQLISKVDTPCGSSRKRHRSVSGTCDTTSKKARSCNSPEIQVERTPMKARRHLYNPDPPEPAPHRVVVSQADVHVSATPTLQQMFDKLSADVNMMYMSLNERFDDLKSTLETRIATKVSQLLDKRVNSELSKIKRDVDSKMDSKFESFKQSMKAELTADLADIRDQISSMQSFAPLAPELRDTNDRSMNIVIRNMPESTSESTHDKVNGLIKNGLKLPNIAVSKAERKKSYNDAKPGVIIATLKTKSDKQAVMKAKPQLRTSDQFRKVFIHHDQPPAERKASMNFATILGALNSDKLAMRGSRVISRNHGCSDDRSNSARFHDTSHSDSRPRAGNHSDDRRDSRRDNRRDDRNDDRRDARRDDNRWTVSGGRGVARGFSNRGQPGGYNRGRR